MRRWPTVIRWIAWSAAGFAAVFVAIAVAAYAYLQTESGRQALAEMVSAAASGPGMDVTIGAIGAGLPRRLAVGDVVARDDQGVWLTVDRAVIEWRPLALLSGTVHVTDVDVGGVHLERLPAATEPEPAAPDTSEQPLEIPTLPVGVQVDRIDIRDIALAEAVVGEAMVLDLSGQIAGEVGAAVRTDLRLKRTDAPGVVTLASELDPAAHTLSVDLEVREPEGGLIARLLGLEPYPPVTVTLKGEGPLDAWRAKLDARVEGLAAVTANLAVDGDGPVHIALQGRADVDEILEPELRPLVEGGIAFSLSADLRDADAVSVERLGVETNAISVSASGHADLADNTIDAKASISASNGDALAPLMAPARVDGVAADVTASGELTSPTLELVATVRDLAAPGRAAAERLRLSAEAALSKSPVPLEVRVDAYGLNLDEAAAAALTGTTATLSVSGSYDQQDANIQIDSLALESGPTKASGHGRLGLSTQEATAALDVAIADVSALGAALGVPLSGPAELSAETEGNLETLTLEGSISGAVPHPSVGIAKADELLQEGVKLEGSYSLDGAEDVAFDVRVAAGKLLELDAEGRIAEAIAADATLRASDLSAFSKIAGMPLSGTLSLTAHAEGNIEDATGTLSVALRDATVDTVAIPKADLDINAADLMQSPAGRLSLEARTGYGPVDLRTDFTAEDFAAVDLRDLAGEILGVRLAGNLRAPLDGGAVTGELNASFEEPGEGRDIAGVRVAGRSELDVRLGDGAGGQTAEVRLDASSLAITPKGGEAVRAERLSLTASLSDLTATPRLDVELEGQNVGTDAFTARTLGASIDGSLADAGFQVRMARAGEPDVRVTLAGRYASMGDTHTVILRRLDGALGEYPLKLARPATVTYAPDAVGLDGLSLGIGKGTVSADGRLGGARTAASLRVAALPLDLVSQFDPSLPLEGTLDASADVRAEGRELAGDATIRGNRIAYGTAEWKKAPPTDMSVNAVWRGGRVDVDARVSGIGGQDLVASARGPLTVNARTLQASVNEEAPISATVRWEGQVEPLWELLPLSDMRLAGRGRIAADVTGTLARPVPTGEVNVRDGTFEHFVAGTLIEDLDLSATVDRGRTIKIALSGNDGGTGRITGDGTADLRDLAGKPIEVAVRFNQATLVRRDDVTATATGRVAFQGTGARGRLEGEITTDRVDIRLVNQLPPSVVTLDVTEVHAKGEPRSGKEEAKPAEPSQIDLDLTVDLPSRVFVNGRGLESEWGGSFRITGTTGAPVIEGSLSIIRGQFTFAGKRFEITRGVVTLDGGKEIEPRIDIVAEYTQGDFTATISVAGPASDPKLTLSSSPSLPQEEILPRVLFGKNASQLSAVEAAQLAIAVQSLTSGGGGVAETLLSGVQNTLGLDVLSVESTGADGQDAALRAGKYIGDRVYVETVQGTQPGSTVYRVEVKIIDTLSAVSSVGEGTEDASGFVGLKWQYRY